MTRTPDFVNPDLLPGLKFSWKDVLSNGIDQKRRMKDVGRAAEIGQRHQGKVKVVFITISGDLKRVYSTIRSYNTQMLYLLGETTLPVRSIVRIEFF